LKTVAFKCKEFNNSLVEIFLFERYYWKVNNLK